MSAAVRKLKTVKTSKPTARKLKPVPTPARKLKAASTADRIAAQVRRKGLHTGTYRVTPTIARTMIEGSANYRQLVPAHVARYAKLMTAGDFMITGDTVRYDWNGNLIDANHRLHAIVQSGKAQTMIVVTGIDPDAVRFIDTGKRRTLKDHLYHAGFNRNPKQLAAALSWVMRYEDGALDGKWSVDPTKALEYAKAHPELDNIVADVAGLKAGFGRGMTDTIAAGVIYSAKGYEDDALAFFNQYAAFDTGNLAVRALHKWVASADRGKQRPGATVFAGVTIRAFNRYVADNMTETSRVKYDPTQPFPKVVTA